MSDPDFRPGKKVIVATVATVAATYAYFLLFAQFGFLKALQIATGGAQGVIKRVLTIVGGAGIFGSGLAAFVLLLNVGVGCWVQDLWYGLRPAVCRTWAGRGRFMIWWPGWWVWASG